MILQLNWMLQGNNRLLHGTAPESHANEKLTAHQRIRKDILAVGTLPDKAWGVLRMLVCVAYKSHVLDLLRYVPRGKLRRFISPHSNGPS